MIYYFAYGSNLHPVRLGERVSSAELVGTAEISGYRLIFHKNGHDGSGKCHLFKTDLYTDSVYGAIYTLSPEHKSILDEFEGKGFGYIDRKIEVPHQQRTITCFTYFAQDAYILDTLEPYHWYKQLVVHGAHYLKFPEAYIMSIEAIESQEDPKHIRRQMHEELLQKIIRFP
jgi:gamma-glutamylcyclotransferase